MSAIARLVRPWKAVLEADDRLPAGEEPRHLDRVLDRLGPAVEQKRPLLVGAWRYPVEPLGQLDIGLVGGDRKADVGEAVELLAAPRPPPRDADARC